MSQVTQVARPETRRDNLQVVATRPVVCADCRFAQLWAVHGGADCTKGRGGTRPVPSLARACDEAAPVRVSLTDLHCVKA